MINVWAILTISLGTPDDQGKDWYGWITNQLGHAMLGLVFGGALLLAGGGWVGAIVGNVVVAATKEIYDLLKDNPDKWAGIRDNIQDLSFWMIGTILATAIFYGSVTTFAIGFGLFIGLAASGIWPRAIRAYKNLQGK
jgi:hypothetical protein